MNLRADPPLRLIWINPTEQTACNNLLLFSRRRSHANRYNHRCCRNCRGICCFCRGAGFRELYIERLVNPVVGPSGQAGFCRSPSIPARSGRYIALTSGFGVRTPGSESRSKGLPRVSSQIFYVAKLHCTSIQRSVKSVNRSGRIFTPIAQFGRPTVCATEDRLRTWLLACCLRRIYEFTRTTRILRCPTQVMTLFTAAQPWSAGLMSKPGFCTCSLMECCWKTTSRPPT